MKLPKNHQLVANIRLSGSSISIGTISESREDLIWILTENELEPTYMTSLEAKLFIASFNVAIENIGEK